VAPAVEPDIFEYDVSGEIGEEFDDPLNMIAVHVAHHEQLKFTAPIAGMGRNSIEGGRSAAIDQNQLRAFAVSILDPQAVALGRGEHLDGEHQIHQSASP
jgi:hypothetical protein